MTKLLTARRLVISLGMMAIVSLCAVAAHADPASEAEPVFDAFAKSYAACDVPAMLALYEDNAVLVWPRQDEMAIGKAAIEKVFKENCNASSKQSVSVVSSEARSAGKDLIIHFGQLDGTTTGPDGKPVTRRIRDTELLHKSGGKWRYVLDHASVGDPLATATAAKTP
ncbi:MAG: YybH family protein [Candidatus Binataceae bacterium]